MATALELEPSTLELFLKQAWEQTAKSDPLYVLKQKAWDSFLALPSPFQKEGSLRAIKWRPFLGAQFSRSFSKALSIDITPWIYKECAEAVIVFVNGSFSPALSRLSALPERVSVLSLNEALTAYSAYLNNHWNKSIKEESDPFVLLNSALHQEGALVLIPSKVELKKPLQLLHIITEEAKAAALMPRLQLFLGAHASVQVLHTQKHIGQEACWVNGLVDAVLEEGSRLEYSQTLLEGSSSFLFDGFRASLKRSSSLKTFAATQGGAIQRSSYRILLGGELAEALLNGVSFVSQDRQSHQQVEIRHESPHCRSFQLFKSVLQDRSRASFNGKIFVTKTAQKTEAFQLSNHLILSDHAIAYSDPNLEIFADDVKASHGSTIGQLREEELFYMRTRGLSQAVSSELLISGFCQQVIEKCPSASMQTEVASAFSPSLHKHTP